MKISKMIRLWNSITDEILKKYFHTLIWVGLLNVMVNPNGWYISMHFDNLNRKLLTNDEEEDKD